MITKHNFKILLFSLKQFCSGLTKVMVMEPRRMFSDLCLDLLGKVYMLCRVLQLIQVAILRVCSSVTFVAGH